MADDVTTTIEMRTSLQSSKVYFKWTVEKWDLTSYSQEIFESENFKLPETDKICFLTIKPYVGYTGKRLLTVSVEKCEQLRKCVVSARIINHEGKKIELQNNTVNSEIVVCKNKEFYLFKFEIVEEYFTENTLVFNCQIDYVLENYRLEKISDSSECMYKLYKEKMLLNDFDKLHKGQQLCDVTFLLGQHQLKAHSFVLATVSPYFLAMFNNEDMIESQEREVDLTNDDDVTLENFQIFLNYLYGATSVYEHKETVYELLVLADKFNVAPLKIACENYLIDTITDDNGAELLLFSDKYNCDDLKKEAIDFAKAHLDVIKQSKVFKDICQHVDIISQLI